MATRNGTSGDDLLTGTAGADSLAGLAGSDTLSGGTGADTLDGGAGRDRAILDLGAETASLDVVMLDPAFTTRVGGARLTGVEALWLTAGSGNDSLTGLGGADSFAGGAGADLLQGGAGNDTLAGGEGADTLLGGAGADSLIGGTGADRFVLQGVAGVESTLSAMDRLPDFKAAEGDRLVLRGQPVGSGLMLLANGVWGLPGQAPLPIGWGGSLPAVAAPSLGMALPDPTGGAAFLMRWLPDAAGQGGWLVLDADRDGSLGAADLVVRIGVPRGTAITAADFLAGSFSVVGTTGADARSGTAGADRIFGLAGNDTLAGQDGNDTLEGGAGNDNLGGGNGFDSLTGGEGDDTLAGGAGPDALVGGTGNDRLDGGTGDDLLQGGTGNDALLGGDGNDSLEGGPGADTLQGGTGADTLLLQAMGEAAWSTLAAMDQVMGFIAAEGDRLRVSDAWAGSADGSGADLGTYAGQDGVARALLWGGVTRPLAALPAGTALPAQPTGATGAYQVFWAPAMAGGTTPAGGWLVLDLDRDGKVGAADLVVRIGSTAEPVSIGPEDFVAGTFLSLLRPGVQRTGTAGNDTLAGGSLAESFQGSAGSDRIAGGAGAPNALSYAGLTGSVSLTLSAYGTGSVSKSAGGADTLSGVQSFTGTAGADRLDAAAAGSGLFVTSLEGREGNDTLIGNGTAAVQASYAASPGSVLVDLAAGTTQDGWGGTDRLVNIRRVAITSGWNDTVLGSAGDDVIISGAWGWHTVDGRGGTNEWRYAGTGDVVINLTVGAAYKAAGTDGYRHMDVLANIQAVAGGAGNDNIYGSPGNDRLAGAAGNDTLDGAAGLDTVAYDVIAPGSDLPLHGAVVDLTAGVATDPWGGQDVLRNVENAWGSRLGDDLTGRAVAGTNTFLRGLAGDDTLRGPAPGTMVMADYSGDPAGVSVDLAAGTARDGWGGTDRLVWIDHARGTPFDDRLVGNAGGNNLQGGAGRDTLLGDAGNDTLIGNAGNDLLDGGPGTDIAVIPYARARTTLTRQADGSWIAVGPEGTDTLIGIERVRFTDGDVVLW
ncbi:calcium-binding protein [Paracraurococcus lichenis]|uniref:Calcium-binding protein n=1 Tax=Paracraurococcus lichenis TaxID=3064888 RepID=A0ABT9DVW9_9PROT|nr:hypothetical protein [Paracraurococcus sp. LOR1-02]MDO9708046.1 hypothetical protein [Paracraurococcus sp. LOR1-02]